MEKSKQFSVEVWGEYAMFTTPTSRRACERISYPFPTYSSLCGIMNSIYYRPGIRWIVDKCRIINRIDYETVGMKSPVTQIEDSLPHNRFEWLYLSKPRYQLLAHYVRDPHFYGKPDYHMGHDSRIERAIQSGGRDTLKLGTGYCFAFSKECDFGEGAGYYDDDESMSEYMFHSFRRNKRTQQIDEVGFANITMMNGIIDFEKVRILYRKWNKDDMYATDRNRRTSVQETEY